MARSAKPAPWPAGPPGWRSRRGPGRRRCRCRRTGGRRPGPAVTASASVAGPLLPAIALPAKNAPAISTTATTAAITQRVGVRRVLVVVFVRPRRSSPVLSLTHPPPGGARLGRAAAESACWSTAAARGAPPRRTRRGRSARCWRWRPPASPTTVPLLGRWPLDDHRVARVDLVGIGDRAARDLGVRVGLDLDLVAALVGDVERLAVDARDLSRSWRRPCCPARPRPARRRSRPVRPANAAGARDAVVPVPPSVGRATSRTCTPPRKPSAASRTAPSDRAGGVISAPPRPRRKRLCVSRSCVTPHSKRRASIGRIRAARPAG